MVKQSKGFIVHIALVDVSKDLRPERTFAEALMRLQRFLPPAGPKTLVHAAIFQNGRTLAQYTREKGLVIMGEYADQKGLDRTPFGEKDLFLEEDVIFSVISIRQLGDNGKWFLDVRTIKPCTCYGEWKEQSNGAKKFFRAGENMQDFTLSFNPLSYRNKNLEILRKIVERKGEHGPMRLVQQGRSIDVDDADDVLQPELVEERE